MKNKLIVILCFLVLSSMIFASKALQNQSRREIFNDQKDSCSLIKEIKVLKYKIDNKNPRSFGFLSVIGDQSIGIRSIAMDGNFVYISDPFHGNIKKVNMNDKTMSNSIQLDKNNDLRTITIFNNLLYVFTDTEKVFILDKNLNYVEEKLIAQYRWVKDIFKQTNTEIILYRPTEDVIQQTDKSMKISLTKIDTTNEMLKEELSLPYEEYENSPYGPGSNHIKGVQYSIKNNNGKYTLKNPYGLFELKNKVPDTFEYYDSKNIDFNLNGIAFFSVSPTEVIIDIYKY